MKYHSHRKLNLVYEKFRSHVEIVKIKGTDTKLFLTVSWLALFSGTSEKSETLKKNTTHEVSM